MVRRKRDFAILVLRCAIIGFGASAHQSALGTEMVMPSKPTVEVIQDAVSSNVSQSLGMRLPEGNYAPPAPLVLSQTDSIAPASQAVGSNSLGVQETKNANASAEPQAVMREIKSATRLSGSKQRRRKPRMAGVPTGLQAVVQGIKEPGAQAVVQGIKEPGAQAVVQGIKEPGAQAVVQETKEPGVQAVAQGTEETEAQETKKTLAYPTPQAEAQGLKVKKAGRKYGMAPVQWGIRLSETFGLERRKQTFHGIVSPGAGTNTESYNSLVNTQAAEIHAKTYVMAPYVAQLKGTLGLVHSRDAAKTAITNSIYPGSGDSSTNTNSNKWFGDGSMLLFSQSRFPFTMSLGVSDSRDSEGFETLKAVKKYLDLNQSYAPLSSTSSYEVNYGIEKDINLGGHIPSEIARRSRWIGRYSTYSSEHRINAVARYKDRFNSTYQNRAKRTDTFSVSDTYLPAESLLSLQSLATIQLGRENSDTSNLRTHDVRATSFGRWQPEDEDLHLFMDGNVRLSSSRMASQGLESLSQSLSGNLGANYFFSSNLRGSANGGVTTTNLNGKRELSTIQLGRVTYTSGAIKVLKNSSYNWDANAGAAHKTGTRVDSSVFGGVGHGLGIPYPLEVFGKKLAMNSRIRQSLDTNISRVDGRSLTFVNGGSVSLAGTLLASSRPNAEESRGRYGISENAVTTAATLSVQDTRTIGGKTPSHKRLYSLSFDLKETGKTVYSRDGLEVEGSVGATQGTGTTEIFGKGLVRYRKTRVFNVRGLNYIGTLTVTPRRGSSANTGVDVNAQDPILPWILDQRLSYKIGQNEVLLRGLFSDSHGTKSSSLWLLFRAWRTIGN